MMTREGIGGTKRLLPYFGIIVLAPFRPAKRKLSWSSSLQSRSTSLSMKIHWCRPRRVVDEPMRFFLELCRFWVLVYIAL